MGDMKDIIYTRWYFFGNICYVTGVVTLSKPYMFSVYQKLSNISLANKFGSVIFPGDVCTFPWAVLVSSSLLLLWWSHLSLVGSGLRPCVNISCPYMGSWAPRESSLFPQGRGNVPQWNIPLSHGERTFFSNIMAKTIGHRKIKCFKTWRLHLKANQIFKTWRLHLKAVPICKNRMQYFHEKQCLKNQIKLTDKKLMDSSDLGVKPDKLESHQLKHTTCKKICRILKESKNPYTLKNFKLNRNGNSILSEKICDLLLVWNVFSILLHYKCNGFFMSLSLFWLDNQWLRPCSGEPYLHS